jgi:hypothetical protein
MASAEHRACVGLAETVLGNPLTLVAQPVHDDDILATTAGGLRAQLEQFTTRGVNYHATKRLLDAHPKWSERTRIFSEVYCGRGDFMVLNRNDVGAYDLVFDTAGPLLVWPRTSTMSNWVGVVYDLPKRNGLGLAVVLPPALMRRLDSEKGRELLFLKDPKSQGKQLT